MTKADEKQKTKKSEDAKKSDKSKSKKKKKKVKGAEWYFINTYSGHEQKVKNQLEARIKTNKMDDQIVEVLVPQQDKIVVRKGKKETKKQKVFPGYILINMKLNDETSHLVKNTEGVIGFIGPKNQPTPLSDEEVKKILAFTEVKQPTYHSAFAIGDAVKIVDGPFADFVGSINEINQDKGQVKVLLSVFGRETPVVLDFLQVKKL